MKTGFLYGILANSKTRVRCVFCGVYIPKANKCIEQHVNGFKHKENIEQMSENGISFNDDILYCKACKVNLGEEESVQKHTDGDNHANWMAAMEDLADGEFIALDAYLAADKDADEVRCEACDITIVCSLHGLEEHVNGFSHRTNVAEKLKPLNGIFPVDNDDEVWCKICDAYIDNTVQSILEHIDDDPQHVSWFDEIEPLIQDQDITIDEFLSNPDEDRAICNKCNVQLPCDAQNIEDHINSETHLGHIVIYDS
ncbi:hypothetical protein EVAR_44865_1 [Eumeta japonica]|uniref:U1-type domain-containing protein n=1 Tax=Eumeta variegata TaxID=151549 RepID=A0A4C1Y9M3_EUMVA|nr:hypothetical protein EVAR_44865_1 [Eumeta japonica]